MPSADSALVVLARAPEPGRVKTRLIPALGPEGAAALHAAFLADVCALTRDVAARRVLAVAGDPARLAGLAASEGMALAEQGGGDLGARMARALAEALAGGAARVLLVGSDSPALPRAHLLRALASLETAEVVVGPAEDGGYWTIGARVAAPELFVDMAWGTAAVFAETRARLLSGGRPFALAEPFWDVDEPADLDRLARLLDADPAVAPATRAALELWYRRRA